MPKTLQYENYTIDTLGLEGAPSKNHLFAAKSRVL